MADDTEKERVYRGAAEVFRLRTSRKHRRCDYSRDTSWFRTCRPISPGDQYVHVTVYPGHDYVTTEQPRCGACCLACASGYAGMDTLVSQQQVLNDLVDDWNQAHPIGTEVRFWSGALEGEGVAAITTSPAWLLGGHTPVVTCGAYPGGIALTHVEPYAISDSRRNAHRQPAEHNDRRKEIHGD